MEEAAGNERNVRALVLRILTVNFAAIHTTSMVWAPYGDTGMNGTGFANAVMSFI